FRALHRCPGRQPLPVRRLPGVLRQPRTLLPERRRRRRPERLPALLPLCVLPLLPLGALALQPLSVPALPRLGVLAVLRVGRLLLVASWLLQAPHLLPLLLPTDLLPNLLLSAVLLP